jgi:N-methylhydantoinase B
MKLDVITLELLRQRLDAVCEEGGRTIQQTAICPIVTESGDFSLTTLDASGRLLAGGGHIIEHFYSATNAVGAILRKFKERIVPGDVFIANDPHNGGGLHPQDVFICRPVYVGETRVAWTAASAHMIDSGGMAPGSFAPDAKECYAEALLLPPVHLIKAGVEQDGIWDIIRNNVRLREFVEMDMRGLIAGTHISALALTTIVEQMGTEAFAAATLELCRGTHEELRRRILQLEDGTYQATDWVEFGASELYKLVCTLTVQDGSLCYDFTGSAAQTQHWHNSHDFIIRAGLGRDLAATIGQDLPFNQGLFDAFEVIAPKGTIVNATPPAPIGVGHLDVTYTATELAMRLLTMAMMVSPDADISSHMAGPGISSAYTSHLWSGPDRKNEPTAWVFVEGLAGGTSAAPGRDGEDFFTNLVGTKGYLEYPDIEVLESWYPMFVDYRRRSAVEGGAGYHRAGARMEMAYHLDGSPGVAGVTLGGRTRLPQAGTAGGYPGSTASFELLRDSSPPLSIPPSTSGLTLGPRDGFVFKPGSGGGWGDPLDRSYSAVVKDIERKFLSSAFARSLYGVVAGDEDATKALRTEMLANRLLQARPPRKPLPGDFRFNEQSASQPLYWGVCQQGRVAYCVRSRAALAVSPDDWTGGCPTIENVVPTAAGIRTQGYLDPSTGYLLAVDVLVGDVERGFTGAPRRWTLAATVLDAVRAA